MSKLMKQEMTWTKAVIFGMVLTVFLLVTLGFIPSIFRYWWAANSQDVVGPFITETLGLPMKDPYTLVRLHDAISMGYQTTAFAIPVAACYFIMEKRRKRLGLRGNEGVKGYLPGK